MTDLLEKALSKAREVSPEMQDHIAQVILDELEDERLWDQTFASKKSQSWLSAQANSVRSQINAGEATEFTKETLEK